MTIDYAQSLGDNGLIGLSMLLLFIIDSWVVSEKKMIKEKRIQWYEKVILKDRLGYMILN